MNESEMEVLCPENVEQQKSYEKPEVTTFGSVAELTMGSSGSRRDFLFGHHHRHGR